MTATERKPSLAATLFAGNDADTYGWDTAFAINFANANAAITTAWPTVKDGAKNLKVTASDDDPYSVDAVLGPWQLTVGGDGKNIRMGCPILSGTYHAIKNTYPLDGKNCRIVIEVGMQWVPDPGQFSFVIGNANEVTTIKAALGQNQIANELRTEFSNHQKSLSTGAQAVVQKDGVEWLITDQGKYFYIFHSTDKSTNEFLTIYQFEKAWENNLKVLAEAASTDQPAVTIVTIVNPPAHGPAGAVFEQLVSDWFNVNVGELNHVFAALDLSPIVSSSDRFSWMKPTATTYAVTDQGTLESSALGVMTMALNHQPSQNHQVSPFAIPKGASAGFLISGPMFIENMLLTGAQAIFNNAAASAFTISNDGRTVKNTSDMVWGKFMMDNKQKGSIVAGSHPGELDGGKVTSSLTQALRHIGVQADTSYQVQKMSTGAQWMLSKGAVEHILNLNGKNIDVYDATVINIAKGQFSMSLMGTYVEIQFIDLNYSYNSDFNVHVNYTEQVQLKLQEQGGKKIFWFDQVLKNLVISVTKTQAAITREIIEGAVVAVLSLIAVAGPVIEGLAASSEIIEVTEEGGSVVIDAEAFANVGKLHPELMEEDALIAAESAVATSSGKLANIKAAFNTPKWKFVGAITGIAGAVTGADKAISAIIESYAKKEWENVPGFDAFANLAIAPYTWPNVKSFTLDSAGLAGSLQVGLKVTPS